MTTNNLPTLAECEEAIDINASEWTGRCYEIAARILEQCDVEDSPIEDRFPAGTRLCYGHFLGERSSEGAYPFNAILPFEQHGWLELPDGTIFDPTRWAFISHEPSIYIGSDEDYDEGGNEWRSHNLAPAPAWDPEADSVHLQLTQNLYIWVQAEYNTPEPNGVLNVTQVFHLANRHPEELPDAETIYEAIVETGHSAAIPIDNQRKYLKEAV